jgi:hypothetical protein
MRPLGAVRTLGQGKNSFLKLNLLPWLVQEMTEFVSTKAPLGLELRVQA